MYTYISKLTQMFDELSQQTITFSVKKEFLERTEH